MEALTMSRKERNRMTIMAGVKRKELSQVQAGELMGLGYRQTKRLWRRYQAEGDAGLIHRLRGRAGLRRKAPAVRAQVLARHAQERYADFGPTLLAEELAKEGIEVDHDPVRRWLLAEGKLTVRRRKQPHRQWRERKPCFGAMGQLDGSHHDWFEGRRPECVLMVMVDGATHRMRARFSEQETARASYDVFEGWGRKYRLPRSLYVDRDSIYRCEGAAGVADQLAGREWQTQFGRAMAALGVELILANSPQAKGRVERMNGVVARPAGQGAATGEDQRPGKRQPVSGSNVSAGVQPAVCAPGGQSAGRAPRPAPEPGRNLELGTGTGGGAGLDRGL
jgi:transposase